MSTPSTSAKAVHSTTRVQRDGDKVWLQGVEGFGPGEFPSSVHGAQARICQAVGESLNYTQLVCYGGLAFRMQVHEKLCPSAAHPCVGYQCFEASNRALPWKIRFIAAFPGSTPQPDHATFEGQARELIRESIDRGVPVHYGSEEDGLIIGYGDGGQRWWCVHPYHGGGREAFWHDQVQGFAGGKWPWGIGVWMEPKSDSERVSPRELALAALYQAVDMWQTDRRGAYLLGEAAYAHWVQWLSDVQDGRVADPKAGMQGNGWCFDSLISYRRSAAAWLAEIGEDLLTAARAPLMLAADQYTRLADGCMKDLDCPWSLTPCPENIGKWGAAMRAEQISRLEAAREHDRAAVSVIRDAVSSFDNA